MKKRLFFPILALLLLATTLFTACGSKSGNRTAGDGAAAEIAAHSFQGMVLLTANPDTSLEITARRTNADGAVDCGQVQTALMVLTNDNVRSGVLSLEVRFGNELFRFSREHIVSLMWTPVFADDIKGDYADGEFTVYKDGKKTEGGWSSSALTGQPLVIQAETAEKVPFTLEFRIQRKGETAFCVPASQQPPATK